MTEELLKLKKELERLKKSVKKQRYGLVWMDVPEAFENDVENKLPILREIPKLAIKNNDGKPTHILIEGDNYHALTCLNYTHKGKIDVIYIDPPYNTGSDGFRYKDKRIISKFPDGTEVPKDHPFRHSYWLSFMRKRLELARDLLRDNGILFISIDDNEQAQLKLLCDSIFFEKNFIANIIWQKVYSPKNQSKRISTDHEYVLSYAKNIDKADFDLLPRTDAMDKRYKNPDKDPRGHWKPGDLVANEERKRGHYIIKGPHGDKFDAPPGKHWAFAEKQMMKLLKDNRLYFGKSGKAIPCLKQFLSEVQQGRKASTIFLHTEVGHTDEAKKELKMFFKQSEDLFETVKPTRLIKQLLRLIQNKNAIVLDFFSGSGTSGHAVMQLNIEDKGKRQFILCTNNEDNICSEVCYPRIKKVIRGSKNKRNGAEIKKLGNSLKYYKAAFIGKNNILNASDEDKIELAHNAGELLAIAENTLELVKQNKYYQLFEDGNKKKYTAVYFREELDQFEKFVEMVGKLNKSTTVYVFSWGDNEFIEEFEHIKNIRVKTIPIPILEIYKNIYNLV